MTNKSIRIFQRFLSSQKHVRRSDLSIALIVLISCGSPHGAQGPGGGQTARDVAVALPGKPIAEGLDIVLSEAGSSDLSKSAPQVAAPAKDAASAPSKLSAGETQKLLSRLPELKMEQGDKKSFALRERSLPPPKTGEVSKVPFPQADSEPLPKAGKSEPLRILRYSPTGAVPMAPHLSVTFSQPMVAVTSQEQAAKSIPVKLTPQPEGNWRWLGTRTLMFAPKERFPMATRYAVSIEAGVASTAGTKLAAAQRWEFTTPPPSLKANWPSDVSARRDTLIFMAFDQRINPQMISSHIVLRSQNKLVAVRLATAQEVEADAQVKQLVAQAASDSRDTRHLVVRPVQMLPADAPVSVMIKKGAPSAEGPLLTEKDQSFDFRTYGPLRVVQSRCGWDNECRPMMPWTIEFSNELDSKLVEDTWVRVQPELPDMHVEVYGNTMSIRGLSKGRTRYKVTFTTAIKDVFGQGLERQDAATFTVGEAEPALTGPENLIVLDPLARKPTFNVHSINYTKLRVTAHQVTPADWERYTAYREEQYRDVQPQKPPGRPVIDQVIQVKSEPDVLTETAIDLSKGLPKGLGHLIVTVRPEGLPPVSRRSVYGTRQPLIAAWVQATHLAVDAWVDGRDFYGWLTELKDGRPIAPSEAQVEVWLGKEKKQATGNEAGLFHFALSSATHDQSGGLIVAKRGSDVAIYPEHRGWRGPSSWQKRPAARELRWYVFDDRQMYRPDETVRLKGWVRKLDLNKGGDFLPFQNAVKNVSYKASDPQGNKIAEGQVELNAFGGFDFSFHLPKTPNLGHAYIELEGKGVEQGVVGASTTHAFQIQEFRRPEYEVSSQVSEGPHLIGEHAVVTIKASYYAGGALPNAKTHWTVTSSRGAFVPPGRDDYEFGEWIPWWEWRTFGPEQAQDQSPPLNFEGTTDSSGEHHLRLDFRGVHPARAMNVHVEGNVTDVNRQTWATSETILVHPSALYVGLRTTKMFYNQGDVMSVDAIVVDHEGKMAAARPVRLRASRLDWVNKKGEYTEVEKDTQECQISSTDKAPVNCRFETKVGGSYRITAVVEDSQGRPNETVLRRWVAGGTQPPARDVELEKVLIVPDKKEYRPGETATLLIQSPFAPAEGVLTYQRSGIEHTERFRIKSATHTIKVPIRDTQTPNLYVQVNLVGASMRLRDDGQPDPKLPKRPAYAKGVINLRIPPYARTLSVEVKPQHKALEPGAKTAIDLTVRDAQGKPVSSAELAAVVVDEAVLSLTNYQLLNPLDTFYSERSGDVQEYYIRELIKLTRPSADQFASANLAAPRAPSPAAEMAEMEDSAGYGGGKADKSMALRSAAPQMRGRSVVAQSKAAGGAKPSTPIAMRKNFDALAVFAPTVRTDAQGKARVDFKVPDNLTRYRVMVVGVSGDKFFGKGESSITARLPLMVRPSAPRFLNYGDRIELPVVVQNQTDRALAVSVALRATNLKLTEGAGQRIQVPANNRVELRFKAEAQEAGTARIQIATASGAFVDAATLSLPIWTPATTEAFATYGEIDNGTLRQPVAIPSNVAPFGGLQVTTSSTQLQALTDAFVYLVQYPYECSEQMASRLLGIAALRDVLSAFKAKGLPPAAKLEEYVKHDVELLQRIQNTDGGFAFWRRGDPSWPYVGIHVAHALARAKAKGFTIPDTMVNKSRSYLRDIKSHIPADYSETVRRMLIAYALYVRKLLGDSDTVQARALIQDAGLEKLPLESVGFLLYVLQGDGKSQSQREAIHRLLIGRVSETAAAAHFVTDYSDGAHLLLHSDRRGDGIILEALIADRPKSDLIPKVVRGLLAHQKRGRWENTQENAFVLLALDKYFHTFEKVTPNFVSKMWLGERYAGEQRFSGRSTTSQELDVPMTALTTFKSPLDLTLDKQGAGRLYYRIGMTYAPASLKLKPADYGFTVERRYEALDRSTDVSRGADGVWHIKAGARVRVKLSMVAPSRRYHVALVDPMPAGLEALNPALAVTGSVPQTPAAPKSRYWWWMQTWYQHQNLRDERAEAFTTLLWEGVHEYSYIARATTPGTFVVPPAKAEEMYHPETFGRSATDRVIVE